MAQQLKHQAFLHGREEVLSNAPAAPSPARSAPRNALFQLGRLIDGFGVQARPREQVVIAPIWTDVPLGLMALGYVVRLIRPGAPGRTSREVNPGVAPDPGLKS